MISPMFRQTGKHLVIEQLVIHTTLDAFDEAMWNTREMYPKVVDKFRGQKISAFLTPEC